MLPKKWNFKTAAADGSIRNLLERQILSSLLLLLPALSQPQSLQMESQNLCVNNSSRWFIGTLKCKNFYSKIFPQLTVSVSTQWKVTSLQLSFQLHLGRKKVGIRGKQERHLNMDKSAEESGGSQKSTSSKSLCTQGLKATWESLLCSAGIQTETANFCGLLFMFQWHNWNVASPQSILE